MSGPSKKEAAKALLKSAWASTRSLATNKTKVELLVEDSTNLDPWGPTGQQMNDISDASFDAEKFKQAWGVILKRFEAEPSQWRRVYKALLLTEHLLKNSSQHAVQTILDHVGVLEGLKQFKYLDEKNKDHGINVSNRAKELTLLLGNSDRIRAERAKAKSLKDKFKGVSRDDMAAAAAGGASTAGFAGGSSSQYGSGREDAYPSASKGSGGMGVRFEDASNARSPPPSSRRVLPVDDGGHGGGEEDVADQARPAPASRSPTTKGYGALAADSSVEPVAATAQRIDSLRQAGMLDGAHVSATGASQSGGKPSLHELMARKAAAPKKLQEVRVNPVIAAALGSIKPPASPTKPAPAVLLPPPTAKGVTVSPSTASGVHSPANSASHTSSPAMLSDLLTTAHEPAGAAAAASSSPVARSSAGSSLWEASHSPVSPAHPVEAACDAFGHGSGAFPPAGISAGDSSSGSFAGDSFGAFAKPGDSPGGRINLTATAGPASGGGSPQALPAHLFAEPVLPAYGSAAGWGSHVAGAVAVAKPEAAAAGGNPFGGLGAPKAAVPHPPEALFSDFSPFK